MARIRPFQFSGLPSWTKEQVAIQESLAVFLSYRPFRRSFRKGLAETLENYLKTPLKFSKAELSVVSRSDLHRLLPDITCLLVIGAAPAEQKIIVDLDSGLASFCVDRLLGGTGEVGRIQRPLTEIEQGVLSFVVLKVLQHFHNGWQNGRELALTLDRFAAKLGELQETIDDEANYHMLGFRISAGKRVGYLRVLLPQSLVTTSFSTPPGQGSTTPEELDYMRRVISRLGSSRLEGRVEIATLDLSADDLANIEVGDIVVLEEHQVTLGPNGLEGQAHVKIGAGENGGLVGRLHHEGEVSRLEITQIVNAVQPPDSVPSPDKDEAAMADGDTNSEEPVEQLDEFSDSGDLDNLTETEGLLHDVAAPVVIELGRIKLSMQQVVKLRPGQILRLPRGPNDPVNLVVKGKLFARGELIEVDGELGVRLTQVVGA